MSTLKPWVPDTDWDSYFVDRTFTGRKQEIDFLSRELLSSEAKAVGIIGSGGMGKTSLAMVFGHSNREFFSAGVYHVHATPFESLPRTVDAHVGHPSSPYLLILDEIDIRPALDVHSEIQELRRSRPNARLICISRREVQAGPIDLTIQLQGINQSEFHELFKKAGVIEQDLETGAKLFHALSGNLLSVRIVADMLKAGRMSPRELLHQLQGFSQSGVLDFAGKPIILGTPTDQRIIVDVTTVSDQLLEKVHANPKLMYELTPRKFEEFVAEILDRLGYEVTVTPTSRDGGKDIYAAKKDHLGSFLYVVECKKYSPDNPIGVGLIRQLNGVVQAEQATAGILATTSFFTKGAQEFQRRISHQMSLKDFLGIQEWLNEVFRR